jgi:phosphatidylglycerophosphate synthase
MSATVSLVHPANLITAVRLGIVVALWAVGVDQPWALVVLATVGAVLDGVDGPIARRSGRVTAFGARFDMETDALLVLTLSVLLWRLDKAGAWVIASGLLRYAFVAASWIWPWLSADLPPSLRRKVVCVVQVVALIVGLAPIVTPALAAPLAAAALALLCWSFLVDVVWLRRADSRTRAERPALDQL